MKQSWTQWDCKGRSGGGLTLAVVLALVAGTAHATGPIFDLFKARYPTTPLVPTNACNICHISPRDPVTWNAYGNALKAAGGNFAAIEDADSDGDTHLNLKEISKGSLPGDSADLPDDIPPAVMAKTPDEGATGVGIDALVIVTFDMAMKTASVNANSFAVKAGATPVAGTFTLSGPQVIFAPAQPLAKGTQYTVALSTGLQDVAGNPLPQGVTWSFTTGSASDTTSPTVTSNSPTGGAVPAQSLVSAIFSEAISKTSVNTTTFTLKAGTESVSGTVTADGAFVSFKPDVDLASETLYTASLSSEIQDLAGNKLATNHSWIFTTAEDRTAPQVRTTTPARGGGVNPTNGRLTVVFSEPMNPATVNATTFTVKAAGGAPVAGTVSMNANRNIATFARTEPWPEGGTFTATVSKNVADRVGLNMREDFVWSFTTLVDTDGDGASDEEDDFPNDPTRATFASAKNTGKVGIDVTGNGPAKISKAHALAEDDATVPGTGKPLGFEFPDGVVFCDIKDVAKAATISIRVSFPTALGAGSRVYGVSKEDGFREFPGAVINGNTVTLVLTDGKSWDADEEENGSISYGLGIAKPVSAPPVSSEPPQNLVPSSSGCSSPVSGSQPSGIAAYGLLLFAALLAVRPLARAKL